VIAPEWVAVSGFGRKRSLSDLAVWGFPEFSRKIFPLKPSFLLPNPFFSPSTLSFNSSTPKTSSSNSLAQVFISPRYPPTLFFSSQPLPTSSRPLSDLLRTPPESLHRVLKRPQKALFRPF